MSADRLSESNELLTEEEANTESWILTPTERTALLRLRRKRPAGVYNHPADIPITRTTRATDLTVAYLNALAYIRALERRLVTAGREEEA